MPFKGAVPVEGDRAPSKLTWDSAREIIHSVLNPSGADMMAHGPSAMGTAPPEVVAENVGAFGAGAALGGAGIGLAAGGAGTAAAAVPRVLGAAQGYKQGSRVAGVGGGVIGAGIGAVAPGLGGATGAVEGYMEHGPLGAASGYLMSGGKIGTLKKVAQLMGLIKGGAAAIEAAPAVAEAAPAAAETLAAAGKRANEMFPYAGKLLSEIPKAAAKETVEVAKVASGAAKASERAQSMFKAAKEAVAGGQKFQGPKIWFRLENGKPVEIITSGQAGRLADSEKDFLRNAWSLGRGSQ